MKEYIKNNKLYFCLKILLTFVFSITIFLDSILSFSGSVSDNINTNYFSKIQMSNIIILFGTWVVSYIIVTILENIIKNNNDIIYNKKEKNKKGMLVFFITLTILIVCWLPYLLSYFPGGIFSDTTNTISEALGSKSLSNHNPILYAFIMRLFIIIGNNINGLQSAIELFTIFQTLVMGITFSYFVYWLYKKNVSFKFLIPTILFYAICRLIPLYAISIWKDTPFCIALFWYILFLAEIIYQEGENLQRISGIVIYNILLLLVSFLRNNGIYIVICTTIVILFIYRKNIFKGLRNFSIISSITIIVTVIIQGPIYKKIGIDTEFVENLGVPMQQIAYVVASDGNITDEQLEFINNICPIDVIKSKYAPCFVDTIKCDKEFDNEYLEANKGVFLKEWFKIFLKNPSAYVKAYLLNTIGFWDVNKATMEDSYINPLMWHFTDECMGVKQTNYIEVLTGKSIRGILHPTFAISSAIYLFILLFSSLFTILKKKYKNLLILLPGFLTWLTIMIAVPLAFSLRYVYILLLTIPFTIIVPFFKNKEENKNDKGDLNESI